MFTNFHDFWLHNSHFTIQSHIVIKIYINNAVQWEKRKLPSTSRSLKTITHDLVCDDPYGISTSRGYILPLNQNLSIFHHMSAIKYLATIIVKKFLLSVLDILLCLLCMNLLTQKNWKLDRFLKSLQWYTGTF